LRSRVLLTSDDADIKIAFRFPLAASAPNVCSGDRGSNV
jgi:hypothetical protein